MPRAVRPQTQRARQQHRRGLLFYAISLLGLVAFGVAYVVISRQHEALDGRGCPESGPTGAVAVLIDHTDDLDGVQLAAVRNSLDELLRGMAAGESLSVFNVAAYPGTLPQIGETRCRPVDPALVSGVTANPAMARKVWEDFQQRSDEMWARALRTSEADQSPILESVRSVAVTVFGAAGLAGKPKSLLIVSDMLHHTKDLSLYSSIPDREWLRSSSYFHTQRPDLSGVRVKVILVRRTAGVDPAALVRFWEALLAECGGTLTSVKSV
jgi:hypothetical protein